MKNKGFTLIELLAIIILLSALAIIIFPILIANFEKKEDEIDKATETIIYSATDQYVHLHAEQYIENIGNAYCIDIADMDNEGLIPIDVSKYQDKGVRIKFGTTNSYKITSCHKAESVTLDHSIIEMTLDSTFQLTATINPDYTTDTALTWKSSNKNIATVSKDGLVTAKDVGTAIIVVKTSNGKTATCVVNVPIPASNVIVSPTSATVNIGSTLYLNTIIEPSNASNKTLTWISSNTALATVSNKGEVTGVAPGTVTITAKTHNGKTATATITVLQPATGVTVSPTSATIDASASTKTKALTATVTPSNASNKTVTWTSSATSVATVSSSGVVTAKAAGTATITATTHNGKTATSKITVTDVTGVTVSPTSVGLPVGGTKAITATVAPSSISNKTVTWTSSSTSVATVSSSGVITAKAAGTATITAKTHNGKTATVSVCVATKVTNFAYSGAQKSFTAGCAGSYQLEVWGAQGNGSYGGYGGYAVGRITLTKGKVLYINVGGRAGYNGGGGGTSHANGKNNGGGATHISYTSGLLKNLKSYVSNILIVAGGGGGGNNGGNPIEDTYRYGGSGGGYQGRNAAASFTGSGKTGSPAGKGGTQSAGGAKATGNFCSGAAGSFGLGSNGSACSDGGWNAGGGGGYYGGSGGARDENGDGAGGGGSGYIGNSALTSKVMYCAGCPTSTATATKTVSTTNASSTATSNYVKAGDGYARITYLGS